LLTGFDHLQFLRIHRRSGNETKYVYVFVSLSFAVMLMGCAPGVGTPPLGITGGSDEGYGKDSDLIYQIQPMDSILKYWAAGG